MTIAFALLFMFSSGALAVMALTLWASPVLDWRPFACSAFGCFVGSLILAIGLV
jgi:hypothetical protein